MLSFSMVLTLVPILKFAVEDKKFKWVDEMDSKHGTSWKIHSIKLAFIKSPVFQGIYWN